MKRLVAILLILVFSFSISAIPTKIVDTAYEEVLLESLGVKDFSKVTEEEWYFSRDGIDKTAEKMVDQLPDEPVILYGISLGGTVSRRMTQIAAERGKTVRGYIAQSSPLSGDRLTNTGWASASLAMLAGYSLVALGSIAINIPFLFENGPDITDVVYDFDSSLDENSKTLINNFEKIKKNKNVDRSDKQSLIENVTLPLLQAVLGPEEKERNDMFNYFSSVFFNSNNNVKDLDPTGKFMNNVMNTKESMEKEEDNSIKRVFIVSKNGNVYDTFLWENVEPILNMYRKQRDTYLVNAKKQWVQFPYWMLKHITSTLVVNTIEDFPRAWSFCVSGSNNFTTNDGFVPVDDTYEGKKLKMTAPHLRDDKHDRTYECDKVSHLDYAVDYEFQLKKQGRFLPRKESIKQQQEQLIKAYNFMQGID